MARARRRTRPRRARRTPYLLLLPGLAWLAVFFVVPLFTLFSTSTQTRPAGAEIGVFVQTFTFANYVDALGEYAESSSGRSSTPCSRRCSRCAISYPLAYAIAFKAGRWRNLLLVLVVAPFFISFLLRTIAWKQILADEAWVADTLRCLHVIGRRTTSSTPRARRGHRHHLQLPAVHDPAALRVSLERVDPRLIEAAGDLYASALTTLRKVTFPLSMPGVVAGTLLTFIPAAGDYVNSALLGNREHHDGRQRHRQPVPAGRRLPDGGGAVLSLMASILVLVALYIRRAGTEELV